MGNFQPNPMVFEISSTKRSGEIPKTPSRATHLFKFENMPNSIRPMVYPFEGVMLGIILIVLRDKDNPT